MRRSILVFLFGDVGDTLLTVPALRAVRERYPSARITVLGKPVAASIVHDLGLTDRVIEVDKHLFDRPVSLLRPRVALALLRLLWQLRRERADVVVIFHHLVSSWGALKFALLSLASGARERVGLNNGKGWFLTRSAPDQGFGIRHEAEYLMEVARLIDAHGPLTLEAPLTERHRARVSRLLARLGISECDELLAIHPGTGWYGPGRRWAAARFAAAASMVLQRRPMRCVIVGTEQEAGEAEEVASLVGGNVVNLVGQTSLGELAAVLQRCSLLIANDGGVAHMAAAAGTPVVAVFGPSNDRAWHPLGGKVVAADLPCRPCFYRDFKTGWPQGCATRECLTLVTPRMVAETALSVLGERRVAV